MEIKTVIYIILGIIWFIFKNRQKKARKKTPVPQPETSTYDKHTESEEDNQPSTFDDIFGQLLGDESNDSPKKEIVSEIDIQPVKKIIDKPGIKKSEGGIRDNKFERFDEFDLEEEEEEVDYTEMFSNNNSAREAFIANEVFSKKF